LALEAFSEKLSTEEKQKAEKKVCPPQPNQKFFSDCGKNLTVRHSLFSARLFSQPADLPISRLADFPALAHLDIRARQGYPFIRNEKRTVTAPSSSLV
jgi:hypothetical protein